MPKTVTITLDRPRRLRYDVNALADAEEAMGMGLGAMLQQHVGIRVIRALLWAGLRWEDRSLTIERAGTMLQEHLEAGGDIEAVTEKVIEALTASGILSRGGGPNAGEAETVT